MTRSCFYFQSTVLERRLERGVMSIEYALLISLILVVILGSVVLLGDKTSNLYDYVSNNVVAALSRN